MGLPTFQFTTPMNQPDQSYNGGMQQYVAQGQASIDPGKAQVAQSSPIAAGGAADLAKALASMQQQGGPTQHPDNPMQTPGMGSDPYNQQGGGGLQSFAQYPTGVNGASGGADPMALAQGLQNAVQQPQGVGIPAMQNYQNMFSGGGYGG